MTDILDGIEEDVILRACQGIEDVGCRPGIASFETALRASSG